MTSSPGPTPAESSDTGLDGTISAGDSDDSMILAMSSPTGARSQAQLHNQTRILRLSDNRYAPLRNLSSQLESHVEMADHNMGQDEGVAASPTERAAHQGHTTSTMVSATGPSNSPSEMPENNSHEIQTQRQSVATVTPARVNRLGTAAIQGIRSRAGSPLNIDGMKTDLEKTVRVGFTNVLMLYIAKFLDAEKPEDPKSKHMKRAEEIFQKVFNEALKFCNLKENPPESPRAVVQSALESLCDCSSETTVYPYLVKFFNAILLHFSQSNSQNFQGLPSIQRKLEDYVISFPSFRTVIKSNHQESGVPNALRKPDIVFGRCSHVKANMPVKDGVAHNFTDFKSFTDKIGSVETLRGTTWDDVLCSVEVKLNRKGWTRPPEEYKGDGWKDHITATGVVDPVNPDEFEDDSIVPDVPNVATPIPSQASRLKRALEINNQTDTGDETYAQKKIKTEKDHNSASGQLIGVFSNVKSHVSQPDGDTQVSNTIVQCALYGVEKLRSSWTIAHSFVILIKGPKVLLQFYDGQYPIFTDEIDIVVDLPLVVTMLILFQRFDLRSWGIVDWKGNDYIEKHKEIKYPRLQLIGRRRYTAIVECHEEKTEAFFKASWPEDSRVSEPDIISKARDRASGLKEHIAPFVLSHIPTVLHWGKVPGTSTALTRELLGLPEQALEGSRSLVWMVSQKLTPMEDLDADDFFQAFMDTIRCHFLLWKIGIAHGDISINNLMANPTTKRGVLNDFDLAAIMNPGDDSPPPNGFERTGTLPFMAIEMLLHSDGTVPRRYRYDLESFAWCLFWHCADLPPGYMSDKYRTVTAALEFKSYILLRHNIDAVFTPKAKWKNHKQWRFIHLWMKSWAEDIVIPDRGESTLVSSEESRIPIDEGAEADEEDPQEIGMLPDMPDLTVPVQPLKDDVYYLKRMVCALLHAKLPSQWATQINRWMKVTFSMDTTTV